MCGRVPDGLQPGGVHNGYVFLGRAKGDEQFGLFRQVNDPELKRRDEERRREYQHAFRLKSNGTAHPRPGMDATARRLAGNLTPAHRAELAGELGLPEAAFASLPLAGFSPTGFHKGYYDRPCWTFPEYSAGGAVCGITCRYADRTKPAIPGGTRGLFIPEGWLGRNGAVFLPEGPSDTLALTALGLSAVGRPSNAAGVDQLASLLQGVAAERAIVVVGEYDPNDKGQWPGRDGATSTAARLTEALRRPVLWTLPPDKAKDVRAWALAQQLPAECLDSWLEAGDRLREQLLAGAREARPQPAADPREEKPAGFHAPDPYVPFPTEALPLPLRTFVEQASAAIGCDPSFVALPALSVVASLIGNSRTVRLKRDWFEPSVVWTGIVGDSGTLKSPAIAAAVGPLYRLQKQLIRKLQADLEEWEKEKAA
jgi:hypothetical protein